MTDDDEYSSEEQQYELFLRNEYLKLSDNLRKFTLEECLLTSSLYEILQSFDRETSVKKMCENFCVNSVENYKLYEDLAKNSKCYFVKLLKDYAIVEKNIEDNHNGDELKTLEDLQQKLWHLNGGKLVCKKIKSKENGESF